MKLKFVILIVLFMIGGGCSCECEDYPNYFDVNGIKTEVTHLETRFGNQEAAEYKLEESKSVDFDEVFIHLSPSVTYYGEHKQNAGFSFISQAYACSCSEEFPGYMGSKEEISEIKIFSNVPFSTSGNASDLLNQYFEISGLGQDDNFVDIDAVLATKPGSACVLLS